MTELGYRSITPMAKTSLHGLPPANIKSERPTFEEVNPGDLFVEESYQRQLRANGVALIRKIYAEFDWARFKPPVCIRLEDHDGILVCIDGQHTATACATHPDIDTIPVMIVRAKTMGERAAAFVGHNRDRLNLTAFGIYRAEIVEGNENARMVDRACAAAGVTIIEQAFSLTAKLPVGSTGAIGTMKLMAKRYGEAMLMRALHVLVDAKRGPIKATEIRAVIEVLRVDGTIAEKLTEIVAMRSAEAWDADARTRILETGLPRESALSSMWCRALNIRAKPKEKPKKSEPQFVPKPQPDALTTVNPPIVLPPVLASVVPLMPSSVKLDYQAERKVMRNGVVLDLDALIVEHRGLALTLDATQARIIGHLLKVMPALLPFDRIAQKVFGATCDGTLLLRGAVERLNRDLASVRLEVKTVPRMGHTLFDLGA